MSSSPSFSASTSVISIIADAKAHFEAGRLKQAVASCHEVLRAEPRITDALLVLGSIGALTHSAGAAVPLLQLAATLTPKDVGVLHALGLAHQTAKNLDQACHCFEVVLTLSPGQPKALRSLAHAQLARQDWTKAQALFAQLWARGLAQATDWVPHALSLHHLKENTKAIRLLRQALAFEPQNAEAWHILGLCLYETEGASAAITAYRQALTQNPKHHQACLNLTAIANRHGNVELAARVAREFLAVQPDYSPIYVNYGIALASLGKTQEAVKAFGRVVDSAANTSGCHSNYVFYHHYLDDLPTQVLYERHYEWSVRHALSPRREWPTHTNGPDPGRRLRIGYVSPDFRSHSCAWFLTLLLAHHDRSAVEVFAYSTVEREDHVTDRLKGEVDVWRSVSGVPGRELARRIGEDQIDILVDLAGHTAHNSLVAFACKPAPVQATWLGYPGTTGLRAIDYRISDPWLTPGNTPEMFSETIYNLPRVSHCFQPPAAAPAVGPLPAHATGYVTFGSFNSFAKLSDSAARLWSAALARVPTARLLLKSRSVISAEAHDTILDRFRRAGADLSRIDIRGGNARQEDHLKQYNGVDIALDSFPYGGMTTTCEALWMGVPVVTLAGERTASRYGHSVLHAVGLGDLVAATPDQFAEIAARLASDLDRLSSLRAGLRDKMAASPLCDGLGFARAMENAYRDMWMRWCKTQDRPGT